MGDEKLLKEIGSRINALRRERGLTQEVLAERMEVSVQMISNLELGKKAIRPENLIKVCDALNVSADYVLRGVRTERETEGFMKKYACLSLENQQLLEKLAENLIK